MNLIENVTRLALCRLDELEQAALAKAFRGKQMETVELYIKLKLAEYTPLESNKLVRQAICISFHAAEQQLNYPLK